MYKSSLLAISSFGLMASAFFFPNQSIGLFAGGSMGGVATYYVGEKERSLNKKLDEIKNRERQIEDGKSQSEYLRTRYVNSLNEVDRRSQELDHLKQQLESQKEELSNLALEKVALDRENAKLLVEQERLNEVQERLNDYKSELNDKHHFLSGLSKELDSDKHQLESLRLELIQWQERNQVKEQELQKRHSEFEKVTHATQERLREQMRLEQELYVIQQVELRSQPILEELEKQKQKFDLEQEERQH